MACFPPGLPKVAGSSPGAARAKFCFRSDAPPVSLTRGQIAVGLTEHFGSYTDACYFGSQDIICCISYDALSMAALSSGMILAPGARGPGLNSRSSP